MACRSDKKTDEDSKLRKLQDQQLTLKGNYIIITGANSGIGYETTRALASLGAHVIMACRSKTSALEAIEQLQKDYESQRQKLTAKLKLEFMPLDLSSLKSVMEFVEDYKEKKYPLHRLVCNAGIAFVQYGQTEDGFERQFQVNYLAHFLLTLHLLPIMKQSGNDVRVVNVSSNVHSQGTFDLDNIQGQRSYGRIGFYNNSKLYQIMSVCAMQRRLGEESNVSVFSLHPGALDTKITRNAQDSLLLKTGLSLAKLIGIMKPNIAQGASTSIKLASDPTVLQNKGAYFSEGKLKSLSTKVRDTEKQEALWKYSMGCLSKYITNTVIHAAFDT